MNEQDMEMLERFVDGELPPDEIAAVERRIADEPGWSAAHADLINLREILQADVAAAVDAADFGDFFARIEARLPDEAPAVEASPVAAREAATPSNPEASDGAWSRLKGWWARNWTPALIGAAAAAAVAFWVASPARDDGGEGVTEVAGAVVVDAVSNEGNKTVLISQPAEDEGATVIWLLDEEEADDKPLDGEDPI